ncbi:tRNA uridine-5-carboxymethylaminomethyl(34) synthesis GTPase MnmE [Petroclostridium xylanilyticum]|uniref:tRNA uridine-5-carboxymethylaminomethyl(34) synthesis GTPase MnmE n=1 Tax=Petroclostridium xylanilyticum TaxID=1792311 RepID=UPI000B985295|nr:tRNA uridine-5-carboxymethylaminomethyl(34) synthesis GTPase MnmE [Petroclostridium xylanilyticum]
MYMNDTIAAISTAPGIGGIGIIRVSGKDAVTIVDKIFKSPKGKKLSNVKSHTIHYGHIVKVGTSQNIDEVLVSVMREPHTFTKEDIVEINCHGGIVSTRNVLEQVLNAGARLADPGEFTKRAFLNGRIDLVQAEAIIDIINSKTNIGLESAMDQLDGSLSGKIFDIRKKLINIAAHLQAAVDFPEDDIDELSEDKLIESLNLVLQEINHLIETADMGKIIREGLSTVIVGKPNAGKSSLLNALVRENRAIVTEIPGTTRDVIEEYINIKGVPLKVVDTAGIRETDDIVERIGVEKSKEFINKADLIILILDGSEELNENDKNIIKLVLDKKVIVLINKVDLETKIEYNYIQDFFKEHPIINISVKTGTGLEDLENTIKDMFFGGKISIKEDVIVTNVRHKDSLIKARQSLNEAINAIEIGMPVDMVSIDIKNAIESLGEIVGLTVSEEIVDQIFREFCLGK